jgi:hypothetical protein
MDPIEQPMGSSVPPLPQTPEAKLRTMESDMSSMEKTGGASPVPQFVPGPIFQPEKPNNIPLMTKETNSNTKKIWIGLLFFLGVLAIGLFAYLYIWPAFFGPSVLIVPSSDTGVGPTPVAAPAFVHKSLFNYANGAISPLTIADYSVISILTALQNEAGNQGADGDLREVALNKEENEPVVFSKYMVALMPELYANGLDIVLRSAFEDDFTSYLYFDENGVWPGYVAALKPNADLDVTALKNRLQDLEFASFSNLFLTPPGSASAFRTGQTKDIYSARFASMGQKGASFNYGLFGDYLIINTSHGGLQKALELLSL